MSKSIFEITLLRHGQSTGNAERLIQGQIDAPLSEQGEDQARTLARYWKNQQTTFDRVIASPLTRAHTTARIIAETLGLAVELNPLWLERSFGDWEGQPFDELRKSENFAKIFHPYYPPGGDGESLMSAYQRAVQAVQELLRQTPGRYLVVSHGAFLNMALYNIFGIDPQKFSLGPRFIIENTAYTRLTYEPDSGLWRVLGFNLQAPQPTENEP